jgi:hypothetical protein
MIMWPQDADQHNRRKKPHTAGTGPRTAKGPSRRTVPWTRVAGTPSEGGTPGIVDKSTQADVLGEGDVQDLASWTRVLKWANLGKEMRRYPAVCTAPLLTGWHRSQQPVVVLTRRASHRMAPPLMTGSRTHSVTPPPWHRTQEPVVVPTR